jgi:hypothetical protein
VVRGRDAGGCGGGGGELRTKAEAIAVPAAGDIWRGQYGEKRKVVSNSPCEAVGGAWIGHTRSQPFGGRFKVWSSRLPDFRRWAESAEYLGGGAQ